MPKRFMTTRKINIVVESVRIEDKIPVFRCVHAERVCPSVRPSVRLPFSLIAEIDKSDSNKPTKLTESDKCLSAILF